MDIQDEPGFTLVAIFQSLVTYSVTVLNAGMQAAEFYITLIPCGYLKIIRKRLLDLTERQDKIKLSNNENYCNEIELIHNDIVLCVRFHQQIMK
jgi:hypothetical protein